MESVVSPITITAAILVFVIILIGAAYAYHSAENAKIEKSRKASMFSNRIRRIEEVMSTLPLPYLGHGLGEFLISEKLDALESIKSLSMKDHNSSIEERIANTKGEMAEFMDKIVQEQHKSVNITSEAQAQQLHNTFHECHRLVLASFKSSRISKVDASKLINYIKERLIIITYELFSYSAYNAQQAEKYTLAIHYYERAIDELRKHNASHTYDEYIQKIKNRIAHAEEQQKAQTSLETPENQSSSLVSKLDELVDEDETWKKKNVYD
ncbi:hypothetical protein [Zooshikella ganghwensis]|uniref:Uncharacterized protein n=1 Tax=Zooshikella ganghwensis TaxID=202772 RepID=A0A4P9VPG4_9GAMM|nr:hypothetical protein [Zooshikella ganghwensis]RDH44579.1 hypothetical protein B9G39_14685 [Zooshikella ganghwensis]